MSGNTFGRSFRVTTFGESHGLGLGATVDGCPAGLPLSEEDVQKELDRRRPGGSDITSPRKEKDTVQIISGIYEGITTGTPIQMLVFNVDVDSTSYADLVKRPRPGHADLTYELKYGRRDHRGGGRSSGRETVSRVMAGAVAKKLLNFTHGIRIAAHTVQIGEITAPRQADLEAILKADGSPVRCADPETSNQMVELVRSIAEDGDSVGGVVEIVARGVPPGVGEPVFDKLDAQIAAALMSIGSVKGVEFGEGFRLASMRGSQANDPIVMMEGSPRLATNRSGGILGGISTGNDIVIRVGVKPTPSISKIQETVDLLTGENVEIRIGGRHDPCIVPRMVPVAESMVAIVLADMMIRGGFIHPSRIDR